ncbi:unnamed protein product [Arctogadus glacialis]
MLDFRTCEALAGYSGDQCVFSYNQLVQGPSSDLRGLQPASLTCSSSIRPVPPSPYGMRNPQPLVSTPEGPPTKGSQEGADERYNPQLPAQFPGSTCLYNVLFCQPASCSSPPQRGSQQLSLTSPRPL